MTAAEETLSYWAVSPSWEAGLGGFTVHLKYLSIRAVVALSHSLLLGEPAYTPTESPASISPLLATAPINQKYIKAKFGILIIVKFSAILWLNRH